MIREKLFRLVIQAIFLLFISIMSGCSDFEYSPNQIFSKKSYRDLNASNLNKLGDGLRDDTVRFIITGDTQRSHNETIEFYKKVNTMAGIDFIIVAGDITEFGNLREMQWVAENLKKLDRPFLAVIGNHDLTSRGRDAFQLMYGQLNYSFVYGGIKFICHDTNSREYSFNGQVPNLPWLKKELEPQTDVSNYVAISHVPPTSPDFDQNMKYEYASTFSNVDGFLTSFHAHNHTFEEFTVGDFEVPFVVTSAIGKSEFLLVEIVNNKLSFEQISF